MRIELAPSVPHKRSESSRDRRTCSSRRTARGLAEIPRITGYSRERTIGGRFESEFGGRGLSNQDRTGRNELCHGRSILLGYIFLLDAGAKRCANAAGE